MKKKPWNAHDWAGHDRDSQPPCHDAGSAWLRQAPRGKTAAMQLSIKRRRVEGRSESCAFPRFSSSMASLDLQRLLAYGPLEIGLAFLPVAVVMGLFSVRFSALLINRFGPLAVLVAGQVVIAIALAWLGPRTASARLRR